MSKKLNNNILRNVKYQVDCELVYKISDRVWNQIALDVKALTVDQIRSHIRNKIRDEIVNQMEIELNYWDYVNEMEMY
jgi:hypothetical protein